MKQIRVTTSWDDGHVLDMRLAALLKKYGVKGTFYIAPMNREIAPENRLTDEQVSELSRDFEIGAHTMTHPRLPQTEDAAARGEIADSKVYLEKVTGNEIRSFCYPRGEYGSQHVGMVRDAGYAYARTIRRYSLEAAPPFESPTTVHAYDHWSYIWPTLKIARFKPFRFLRLHHRWDRQATFLFDRAMREGGVFHLWGHSWEIEKKRDWERLEAVLKYISARRDVTYHANGELI